MQTHTNTAAPLLFCEHGSENTLFVWVFFLLSHNCVSQKAAQLYRPRACASIQQVLR